GQGLVGKTIVQFVLQLLHELRILRRYDSECRKITVKKRPSEEGRTFSLRISEAPCPSKNSGPGRSPCTIRRVPGL
ncbi:MAG TPA: hypothetical protein P5201_12005, partial [Aminobacteriaceae bacterium]|nr:hypothetical protein [Aminobacteriaceae bacterium]